MDDQLERASHLLDLRRPVEAETMLRSILAHNPAHGDALHELTRALRAQSRGAEAVEVALRAVQLEPDVADRHVLCAYALLGEERFGEAYAAAREATRLAPHDWRARHALGYATIFGGPGRGRARLRAAVDCAREAIRLAPHEPDAHTLLGDCQRFLGSKRAAARAYAEAARMDPNDASVMHGLAAIHLGSGQIARAGSTVTAGLAAAPQDKDLRRSLNAVVITALLNLYLSELPYAGIAAYLVAHRAPYLLRLTCVVVGLGIAAAWFVRVSRRLPFPIRFWSLASLRPYPLQHRALILGLPVFAAWIAIAAARPTTTDTQVLVPWLVGFGWMAVIVTGAGWLQILKIQRDRRRR